MNLLLNDLDKNIDTEYIFDVFSIISKYSFGEIILTDEKFNIIFHNTKYLSDKVKNTLFDVTDNFMNDDIRINIENFKNSDKKHIFFKLIFNDNDALRNLPVDVHICKIKSKKDKIKGYCVIIQDISQEVENKIQRETFIDIISHDLKTPINANIQILELILNNKFGKINNDLKFVLDELLNSSKFINYMAENLLLKYKNEFDLYELQKEKYSIVQLIKDSCDKLNKLLSGKKQIIELNINGNIEDVCIDIEKIEKVINNLIVNSSEQSKEKSKITIEVLKDNDNINVLFKTNGYKQKNEHINKIFDEYLSCSNKLRKIGFGIELYNCKRIIEAHGGSIDAKNNSGSGMLITFSLPTKC